MASSPLAPLTFREVVVALGSVITIVALWFVMIVVGTWGVRACVWAAHWAWTVGR